MRLSFEFEDFFRHKTTTGVENCDIKTPTFLLQSGVVGDLKIKELPQTLLDDDAVKLEVKLEGEHIVTVVYVLLTIWRFDADRDRYQSQ